MSGFFSALSKVLDSVDSTATTKVQSLRGDTPSSSAEKHQRLQHFDYDAQPHDDRAPQQPVEIYSTPTHQSSYHQHQPPSVQSVTPHRRPSSPSSSPTTPHTPHSGRLPSSKNRTKVTVMAAATAAEDDVPFDAFLNTTASHTSVPTPASSLSRASSASLPLLPADPGFASHPASLTGESVAPLPSQPPPRRTSRASASTTSASTSASYSSSYSSSSSSSTALSSPPASASASVPPSSSSSASDFFAAYGDGAPTSATREEGGGAMLQPFDADQAPFSADAPAVSSAPAHSPALAIVEDSGALAALNLAAMPFALALALPASAASASSASSSASSADASSSFFPASSASASSASSASASSASSASASSSSSSSPWPSPPPPPAALALALPPLPTPTAAGPQSATPTPMSSRPKALVKNVASRSTSNMGATATATAIVADAALQSEVMELQAQVASLRNVWHESRDELAKAKQRFLAKEEVHKKTLKEKEAQLSSKLDEQRALYEDELKKMKAMISVNQVEFEAALQARSQHHAAQDRVMSEEKEKISSLQEELSNHFQRIGILEQERDNFQKLQAEQMEAHQRMLHSLRDEQKQRESVLDQQKHVHLSTLHQLQSRETALEEHHIEYVRELAAAQRALEGKSQELQRTVAEKRFLEADQQALHDQINGLKAQLEAEKSSTVSMQHASRERLKTLNARLDLMQAQVLEAQHHTQEAQLRAKDLERKLESEESSPLQGKLSELEKRMRTMADHLLQKQTHIERLSSERSAATVQLEHETARVQMLEKRLKDTIERATESDDYIPTDFRRGGRLKQRMRGAAAGADATLDLEANDANGGEDDIKARTVDRAVTFLDGLGSYVGFVLRKHPTVRLVFALYVLLIHLWVAFVLYHFRHHDAYVPKSLMNP